MTLKTQQNEFKDWVHAGEDYLRLQLACTQFNYYLHPLSQVLEEFEEMKTVRLDFEQAMGIKKEEKIQMALRFGKSKKPFQSYRRKIGDLMT